MDTKMAASKTQESKWLSAVRRCHNAISDKVVGNMLEGELKELLVLLKTEPISSKLCANLENLLESIIVNTDADWVQSSLDDLNTRKRGILEDFFCSCPLRSSLSSLLSALDKLRIGVRQDLCLRLLEEYFKSERFFALLLEESFEIQHKNDSCEQTISLNIISAVKSLPDKIANNTRGKFSDLFHHKNFFQLLAIQTGDVIQILVDKVGKEKNVSIGFLAQMIGQFCLSGKADDFLGILLSLFTVNAKSDFVWQKVIQKIMSNINERHLEPTVLYIVKNLPWYGCMAWIFGDLIQHNKKLKFLLLHKFIFVKHFQEPSILKNIIGYVSDNKATQHLVLETLEKLLSVWSDSSSIKHVSYEQHKYITEAIIICVGHLTKQQVEQKQHELTMWLAPGMSSHLDSTDTKIRRLGMIVGEIISEKANVEGTNKLEFEYEKDDETTALINLLSTDLSPPEEYFLSLHEHNKTVRESVFSMLKEVSNTTGAVKSFSTSKANFLKVISSNVTKINENVTQEVDNGAEERENIDSDDDSEDDLQPYDLSNDKVYKKVKAPMYIRDCMEGLLQHEDRDKMKVCINCVKKLIEEDPVSTREISIELCKILLLLEDTFALDNFALLRISSMSTLTAVDPEKVAGYLTQEFYADNYSLQHRLDILDVLTSAAGNLSSIERSDGDNKDSKSLDTKDSPTVSENPESWREIVEKRIESKTRRFGKGKKKVSIPKENKFGPVAGCFFYPLLSGYDKRLRTMDLMGTDSLVLGRLLYSLGTIVYSAMNTLAVNSMATSLLEFIIEIQFHPEAYVRQAALFCVSMAVISAGKNLVQLEIMNEITDWIHHTMSKDVNDKTKKLAAQTAFMIKNHFSKELGIET